jgi:hypothetical protein
VAGRVSDREVVSAGRRRADKRPGDGLARRALLLLVGIVLAAAVWVFLVISAIDLGRTAREDGSALGWAFTVAATLGAALCLLLVFVLAARLRAVFKGRVHHEPGRHR